jgi:hypothetical protein
MLIDEVKRGQILDAKPLNVQQVAERCCVSRTAVNDWMKIGLIKGFT